MTYSGTSPDPFTSSPLTYFRKTGAIAVLATEHWVKIVKEQDQDDIEVGLQPQQWPTKAGSPGPGEPCSVVPDPLQQDDSPPAYSASSNLLKN